MPPTDAAAAVAAKAALITLLKLSVDAERPIDVQSGSLCTGEYLG